MFRPERQWNSLNEKIATKEARSRKRGKRAKRWRKWIESYKAVASGTAPAAETPAS